LTVLLEVCLSLPYCRSAFHSAASTAPISQACDPVGTVCSAAFATRSISNEVGSELAQLEVVNKAEASTFRPRLSENKALLPVKLRLTGPDGLPGAAAIQVGVCSFFLRVGCSPAGQGRTLTGWPNIQWQVVVLRSLGASPVYTAVWNTLCSPHHQDLNGSPVVALELTQLQCVGHPACCLVNPLGSRTCTR
jgi:hypothetical protein